MVDTKDYQYQHGFSDMHSEVAYDAAEREQKSKKSLAVIDDFIGKAGLRAEDLSLLDIGCSTRACDARVVSTQSDEAGVSRRDCADRYRGR